MKLFTEGFNRNVFVLGVLIKSFSASNIVQIVIIAAKGFIELVLAKRA